MSLKMRVGNQGVAGRSKIKINKRSSLMSVNSGVKRCEAFERDNGKEMIKGN